MKKRPRYCDRATSAKAPVLVFAIAAALLPGFATSQSSVPQIAPLVRDSNSLMAEEHRASVSKIVVLPGLSPVSGSVTGSYGKETIGLIDGMDKGRGLGTFSKEVVGIPMKMSIPILTPILGTIGALVGGASGGSKRALQDFRDGLTDEIAESANQQLSNEALATDVFWRLREVPSLKPKILIDATQIPTDTDAILYVSFSDSDINVRENEAVIRMSATATLRRLSDGAHIYENQVHYQDTDTLQNWTKNDVAAWHDFANFARHYLGREISAEIFERVLVKHDLHPAESNNVSRVKKKSLWFGSSKSTTPTLAWEHTIDVNDGDAPWAKTISAADIAYEVEIYDSHQIVYAAKRITDSEFTVDLELQPCMTYHWSVRPSYKIDGELRFGEWMRSNPDSANGNDGSAASVATAYIYDFAKLEIACGR
jgi:hypothetical protein